VFIVISSGVSIVDPTTGEIIVRGDKNYDIEPDVLNKLRQPGDNKNTVDMSRDEIKEVYGYDLRSVDDLDHNDYTIRTAKSKMTIFNKTLSFR
jgi:hypothetical protein